MAARRPAKSTAEKSPSTQSGKDKKNQGKGRHEVGAPTKSEFRDFQSFPQLLEPADIQALKAECEALFDAKSKKVSSAYSEGQTFWIAADSPPRFLAESYALELFAYYTRDLAYVDPSCSGAEYWPLCIGVADSNVAPHYDKDYGAEDDGLNFYPNVGTVTYLSETGAPTVFFQQLENATLPDPITRGWISTVVPGKHVSFDGRFLHCALAQLLPVRSRGAAGSQRVTFLVNIWINHLPRDPIICPFLPSTSPFGPRHIARFSAPEQLDQLEIGADANKIAVKMENNLVLEFFAPVLLKLTASSAAVVWQPDCASLHACSSKKKDRMAAARAVKGHRR
jgi:hypothetical protein